MNAPLTQQTEDAAGNRRNFPVESDRETRRSASTPARAGSVALPMPRATAGERAALAFLMVGAAITLAQALGVIVKFGGIWQSFEGWAARILP